jgi:hypothetical protein
MVKTKRSNENLPYRRKWPANLHKPPIFPTKHRPSIPNNNQPTRRGKGFEGAGEKEGKGSHGGFCQKIDDAWKSVKKEKTQRLIFVLVRIVNLKIHVGCGTNSTASNIFHSKI